MTQTKSPLSLKSLILQEAWQDLLGTDPDMVALALSFEDALRLVNSLYSSGELYESTGYSTRLLCALERYYPADWYDSWRNEAFLGVVYSLGNMEQERFYAFVRARTMVDPMPGSLANWIACCRYMPGKPLVSDEEALQLNLYALTEYPFLGALQGLRSLYKEIGGHDDKVQELNELLDKSAILLEKQWIEEPNVLPLCLSQPYEFSKSTSNIDVSFYNASTPEIWEWVRLHQWDRLEDVDPRRVIDCLTFKDALRACYRMLQASPQVQDYAVRILYALRWGSYEVWADDWHCDAFLGYACELTRRFEEQVSGYLQATHHISDYPRVPHELAIAIARSHFVPYPAISASEAIEMLQNIIKEHPYIDALLLLKRLYRSICRNDDAANIERMLVQLKGSGHYAPSILPACVTEPYENLEA